MNTQQLEKGLVSRWTNLDEIVDADLKAHPSRGEDSPVEPSPPHLKTDEIRDLACCDAFVRESASEFCATCGYTNLDHSRKRAAAKAAEHKAQIRPSLIHGQPCSCEFCRPLQASGARAEFRCICGELHTLGDGHICKAAKAKCEPDDHMYAAPAGSPIGVGVCIKCGEPESSEKASAPRCEVRLQYAGGESRCTRDAGHDGTCVY